MHENVKPHLKDFLLYLAVIIIVIAGFVFFLSSNNSPKEETRVKEATDSGKTNMKQYANPPKMEINTNKKYNATLNTSKGIIELNLFASENPETVNNFVFLSKDGFYNGTTFHRIVKDFMIQGGDPKGDGTGGPGYKFNDEKITRDYKRGILAMANSGPNTNGSQFFIMQKDTPLPKNYVIFGEVVKGMDVVDKIADTPTEDNGMGEKSKPTEPVIIQSVTISEK